MKTETFLEFIPYQIEKKKTINVEVRNKFTKELLGDISWDTGWRKYVFITAYNGIRFCSKCERELADYQDNLMKEYKKQKQEMIK
jgi:hypothetical protein